MRGDFTTPLAQEIRAMPSTIEIAEDYSAEELRTDARRSKDVSRAVVFCRWLRFEMERTGRRRRSYLAVWKSPDVARLGSSSFNALKPGGPLIDTRTEGPKPRLSEEQGSGSVKIVEAGPDREKEGVVQVAAGRPQACHR